MGTEIYEVNFASCTSGNECYRKIKAQILYNKYTNFQRTDRNVARAKLYGDVNRIFDDEIPQEFTELNNAYKLCASEQLKIVILDLARKENVRIAKENGTTVKTENLFVVEPTDSKLMKFYKEKLFRHEGIITEDLLDELEEIVDFSAMDKDEDTKEQTVEAFNKTQTSVNKYLSSYEVGFTELKKEHKAIIDYNNKKEYKIDPEQEKNASEIIADALDIDDKTVIEIEKAINADATSEQKAKAVRDAVEKLVAEEIDEKTATETTYADAYKKYDLLVKYSLADKYGFQTKEYMDAREKNYADKIFEKIDPQAEAKYVKDKFDSLKVPSSESKEGERNMYLENAAAHIKHLKDVHAKRGFWTRFTDWFSSKGEDSTIKAMQKRLKELGYNSEEISNATNNSDKTVSGSFHEYEIKTYKQNLTFIDDNTKKNIEKNILHPENMAKYKITSTFFDELEQAENEIENTEKMFDENGEFVNEEDKIREEEQRQIEEQEFKENIVNSINKKANGVIDNKGENTPVNEKNKVQETDQALENSNK